MKRVVGYAKMGRTLFLDPEDWNTTGGDSEPPAVLRVLADRNPDVEFRLVTRMKSDPRDLGYPPNVTAPLLDADLPFMGGTDPTVEDMIWHAYDLHAATRHLYEDLDSLLVWSGPHGSIQHPIPKSADRTELTRPHQQYVNYAAMLVMGINYWRNQDPLEREEAWLVTDPRHYVRPRDLKWPVIRPIISQYDWTRKQRHERYGDPLSPEDYGWPGEFHSEGVWECPQQYVYSRLEMSCLVDPTYVTGGFSDDHSERGPFGLFINEAKRLARGGRKDAMRDWILPLQLDPGITFMHGRWSDASKSELGLEIGPAPWEQYFDLLRSVHCTITTPASGTGWATTKPWEAFAAGTVCFFHPRYDDQGHIIPTLSQVDRGEVEDEEMKLLAQWLRPSDPDSFKKRVHLLHDDEDTWQWLVRKQRQLFDDAVFEARPFKMMENRFLG